MSGAAFLRLKKLKGAGIVLAAARHNRRAIQAERGASGPIDPTRTSLNETLRGPATPEGVAKVALDLMVRAGVGKLRKDAVVAVEILFSLPVRVAIDDRDYFARCVAWSAEQFGGLDNILSADVHRDEAAPHCHVLVLPLKGTRMVGSDMVGNRRNLLALQGRFFKDVAQAFGLRKPAQRLAGTAKAAGAQAVLAYLRTTNDGALKSSVWSVIREAIEADPAPSMQALGIAAETASATRPMKTMAQIFTSKGKGPARELNPIGFAVA